ncbi:hypothetical protein BKA70DRAFT_1371730 [Coprinopsis sp. MPI-PUGE-AT-0042]|nr:hypothetical protein BKA70DRAFT_1371730 [Coprinopsis sp. MPI-PUGE-AT-0042]
MPPNRGREQLVRQAAGGSESLTPETIAKRTRQHLDELEVSDYASRDGSFSKGRARQPISDKRKLNIPGKSPAATSRKSTMSVRDAILYRKNFATLLEESKIDSLPPTVPTYLTAAAPPSKYPPRRLCSVCGYWAAYSCRGCAMAYCDHNCEVVHNETRCERRMG